MNLSGVSTEMGVDNDALCEILGTLFPALMPSLDGGNGNDFPSFLDL